MLSIEILLLLLYICFERSKYIFVDDISCSFENVLYDMTAYLLFGLPYLWFFSNQYTKAMNENCKICLPLCVEESYTHI